MRIRAAQRTVYGQGVIPIEVLPLTVLAGWALFTAIEATMTLVGYGSDS